MSTISRIEGIRALVVALEDKARQYRRALQRIENPDKPYEQVVVTTAEVGTLENLILDLSSSLTGVDEPPTSVWERCHPYCSRNEKASREPGDIEYFRWFLIWLQQCRAYLTYLEGYSSMGGDPHLDQGLAPSASTRSMQPYDVALSFAGPDRLFAGDLAELLRSAEIRVFYDEYEKGRLWGEDLYAHLCDVYKNRAKYCVMFLSCHYAERLWTNHERKAAQARAIKENAPYILPIRLDDTEIPGIHETLGYLDLRQMTIDEVFHVLQGKLADDHQSS